MKVKIIIIICNNSKGLVLCVLSDSHREALKQNLELFILPHAKYKDIVNIHPSLIGRRSQTLGMVTW